MTDRQTGAALPPGGMIGILGGGQLGRMLALAAARLGMRTHIFCPDPHSPAFEVTPHKTVAAYTDESALAIFADAVDVITYEFENVPVETAEFLADRKMLLPNSIALRTAQDRREEKHFLESAGIALAPWREINDHADLQAGLDDIGLPGVLKTARLGYDGKGQRMINTRAQAAEAWADLAGQPLVFETFVRFEREVSVIAARSASGKVKCYAPSENVHKNHILSTSTVPARVSEATEAAAQNIASRIAEALVYVGVLGVEFFVSGEGGNETLLVNEIAPRVHNSGHWTEAVCVTDQFEQHIRAICGWPLGDTRHLSGVVMHNLVGDDVLQIPGALTGNDRPHLYGKSEIRPGRKMGHLNRITP